VLPVEDEALILSAGRSMLKRLGYTVLTAGTPGEALRQAEVHTGEIQLLTTGRIMPELIFSQQFLACACKARF
jgi:two-component system cell cycle sensor histidine kinase/response regulator CckA